MSDLQCVPSRGRFVERGLAQLHYAIARNRILIRAPIIRRVFLAVLASKTAIELLSKQRVFKEGFLPQGRAGQRVEAGKARLFVYRRSFWKDAGYAWFDFCNLGEIPL